MKNANHGNALKISHLVLASKALATNLNPKILTPTTLTDLQVATGHVPRHRQVSGAMLTSHAPTIWKIASGSSGKMLNETIGKISTTQLMPFNRRQLISESTLMISMANAIGDHATEHHPRGQWVTSTIFPTTTATIPDVIVQPLPTTSLAAELPIETAVVNITNSQCLLLFVNNTPNSIKLRPNQLLAVAKHVLGFMETHDECQVATAAADRNLNDQELAALDKLLPCHTDQQKLDFTLNKMTAKTYVTAAQKSKALRML
uniref:Uncharacterized protein n=1 Tax=Romanomermis culicivorax TaxID=13658 RepID=A0A915J1U3_ROMCU